MPETNETQAPDAALENSIEDIDGPAPQETQDENSDQAPSNEETPLDDVTDEDELYRRLEALDNPKPPDDENPDDDQTDTAPVVQQSTTQKGPPKNFRLHTDDPKRAAFFQLLRQHPDRSPVDLAKEAGYELPTGTPAQTQVTPPPKQESKPEVDPLKPYRDKIAEIKAQKEVHRKAFDYDALDKANEELMDANRAFDRAEQNLVVSREQDGKFDSAYKQARAKADQLHPNAGKADTRQSRLLKMALAVKQTDDPAFFEDPTYPVRILAELEREFPADFPKSGAPAQQRKPGVHGPASRPVGEVVAATRGGPQTQTQTEVRDKLEAMDDLEELMATAEQVERLERSRR